MLNYFQKEGMYMKKIINKYCGAILLYSVIIVGVFALNARFKYLNEMEMTGENSFVVAMGN